MPCRSSDVQPRNATVGRYVQSIDPVQGACISGSWSRTSNCVEPAKPAAVDPRSAFRRQHNTACPDSGTPMSSPEANPDRPNLVFLTAVSELPGLCKALLRRHSDAKAHSLCQAIRWSPPHRAGSISFMAVPRTGRQPEVQGYCKPDGSSGCELPLVGTAAPVQANLEWQHLGFAALPDLLEPVIRKVIGIREQPFNTCPCLLSGVFGPVSFRTPCPENRPLLFNLSTLTITPMKLDAHPPCCSTHLATP